MGNVAQSTDGVGHAVAHAEECGAECHAGHGGGVVHLLLGLDLVFTRLAVDGLGEVVPNQLGRVQRHAIGEIVGIDGDVSSKEWVRASKPASDASLRGWVRASTGSTMATDGVSA